jgi:hypothetical protein
MVDASFAGGTDGFKKLGVHNVGIYNHENCATEVLLQNEVREFLLVFAPLRLKGATGSPGAPIAVV